MLVKAPGLLTAGYLLGVLSMALSFLFFVTVAMVSAALSGLPSEHHLRLLLCMVPACAGLFRTQFGGQLRERHPLRRLRDNPPGICHSRLRRMQRREGGLPRLKSGAGASSVEPSEARL